MNGINTTEGAPVVASVEPVAAPVVAETKKPAARKRAAKATTAVIVRRKVLAGKHKVTGAPKLEVIGLTKNPRRGSFTLRDIFQANGETISLLTIKKRKQELIDAGKLVLDIEAAKRQHEGHGRPPEYFNFDLSKGEVKKPRARKAKTAPVVAAEGEQPAAPVNIEAAREFIANVELPPVPPAAQPVEAPAAA